MGKGNFRDSISAKTLSVLCSAVMTFGMTPAAAFAEPASGADGDAGTPTSAVTLAAPAAQDAAVEADITYADYAGSGAYGDTGHSEVTGLNNKTAATTATVPATHNSLPVTKINGSAFRDATALTSVTLPDSITEIGYQGFRGCTSLTTIDLPSGLTTLGQNAFRDCSALTSITIPSGITALGDNIFQNCSSLASVTLPAGLTSIGTSTFRSCTSLAEVVIPDGVTSLGYKAFGDCTSLTKVTIPDSVTTIDSDAFAGDPSTMTIVCSAGSAAATFAAAQGFKVETTGGTVTPDPDPSGTEDAAARAWINQNIIAAGSSTKLVSNGGQGITKSADGLSYDIGLNAITSSGTGSVINSLRLNIPSSDDYDVVTSVADNPYITRRDNTRFNIGSRPATATAVPITFTLYAKSDTGHATPLASQAINMVLAPEAAKASVTISPVDSATGTAVAGATIKVTEDQYSSNTIDPQADGTYALEDGKTYYVEITADGYRSYGPTSFTATTGTQTVQMTAIRYDAYTFTAKNATTGEAIANPSISVKQGYYSTVSPSADGTYSLQQGVAYTVSISADGYASQETTITPTASGAGQSVPYEFSLVPVTYSNVTFNAVDSTGAVLEGATLSVAPGNDMYNTLTPVEGTTNVYRLAVGTEYHARFTLAGYKAQSYSTVLYYTPTGEANETATFTMVPERYTTTFNATDASGKAIDGATYKVEYDEYDYWGDDIEGTGTVTANADGSFTLPTTDSNDNKITEFRVTASAKGYKDKTVTFKPEGPRANLTQAIELEPDGTMAPAVIANESLADGRVGVAYSDTITATPEGCTFAATGLPEGLSIDEATGAITGTPTAGTEGAHEVSITATPAIGVASTKTLTLTVKKPVDPADQAKVNALKTRFDASLGALRPHYANGDTNIDAYVLAMLKSYTDLDSEGVTVSVASTDDASHIAEDGTIHYNAQDALNSWGGFYGANVSTTFTFACGEATATTSPRNVTIGWDQQLFKSKMQVEADSLTFDTIKGSNASADEVTGDLTLPRHMGSSAAGSWSTVTWASSNPDVISVEDKSLWGTGPYTGVVKQPAQDTTVTLTATFAANDSLLNSNVEGQADFGTITKTFEVTVRGSGQTGPTEEDLQAILDQYYTNDLITVFDSSPAQTADLTAVQSDLQLPRYTRIRDAEGEAVFKNREITVTSSDESVAKVNGYRVVVDPFQDADTTFDLVVTFTRKGVTATKTIPVTVKAITDAELDAEIAKMDLAKAHYWDGINDGTNPSANEVTANLHPFQEMVVDENGAAKWIYDHDDLVGNGIIPDDYFDPGDLSFESAGYNKFKTSNNLVVQYENLLVTRPATDTQVTISSLLSSEKYGHLAKAHPDNAKLQKLYKQEVSVTVTVKGTSANPAQAVIDLIAALPDPAQVTVADSSAIARASDAYDALTDEQKARVTNAQKLQECKDALARQTARLAITTTVLPDANEGSAYSATLEYVGQMPLSWTIVSDQKLPAGLTLDATTGVISGTPAEGTAGSYAVTVRADNGFQTATQDITVKVAAATPAPSVEAPTFLNGASTTRTTTVGKAIAARNLYLNGGAATSIAYDESALAGSGLTLALGEAGDRVVISGTPAAQGTYAVPVTVSNEGGSATIALTIVVGSAQVAVTTPSLPAATVGQPYSATIESAGYPAPKLVLVAGSKLPAGLAYHDNGDGTATISGTPTEAGTFALSVHPINNASSTVNADYELVVSEAAASSRVERLAGSAESGAAGTAAAIAAEAFAGQTADTVVIARNDDYHDALAASGLAGALGAPILLTDRGGLSQAAADEISELGATKAVILGGTSAVSDQVRADLKAMGLEVDRLGRADVYGTSMAINERLVETEGANARNAVVVNPTTFADALSISGWAYANKVPVMLQTWGDTSAERGFDDEAKAILQGRHLIVCGGEQAVSSGSVSAIDPGFERLGGETIYDTSLAIAGWELDHGMSASDVTVASAIPDYDGVDALAGSALAGRAGGVTLLAQSNGGFDWYDGGESAIGFIRAHASDIQRVHVLGGAVASTPALYDAIREALGEDPAAE